MKCRRDRYLRRIHNYPREVSIKILQAILDDRVIEENTKLFETWAVSDMIHFLKTDTFHHRYRQYTQGENKEDVIGDKRKRHQVDKIDEEEVHRMIQKFQKPGFMTSHDHLEMGAVQNFSCHSLTGLSHLIKGRHINPFNYQCYVEVMEAFNFYKHKPSVTILRNFSTALRFAEIEENMIRFDLKHYDDVSILEEELRVTIAYRNEFRSFLSLMRSDYLNTGSFTIDQRTASDIEEAIRYNNPNALLFASFVCSFCRNSDKSFVTVIKLLCDCIKNCGAQFKRTVEPYAKCALAMTNMHVGRTEQCIETLNSVLKELPNMYRALDLRSQICMGRPELMKQALEDNELMFKCEPEISCQLSKLFTNRAAMYAAVRDKESEVKLHVHAMLYDENNCTSLNALLLNAYELNDFELFESRIKKYLGAMSHPVNISKTLFLVADIYKKFDKMNKHEMYTHLLKKHALSYSRIS
ncbi:abcA2 [Acrasis kona]|uniref:AbcA2 n=1 Tax=Acrasis kona TaxID=1008807 RepID=A0AAW2ZSR8_9EUKA